MKKTTYVLLTTAYKLEDVLYNPSGWINYNSIQQLKCMRDKKNAIEPSDKIIEVTIELKEVG